MYHDRYFPFYMDYSTPLFYEGESQQEREFQLIKTYYPMTAQRIQEKVEEICDHMDYPGSPIYDEYPDRFTMDRICRRVADEMAFEMTGSDVMRQSWGTSFSIARASKTGPRIWLRT